MTPEEQLRKLKAREEKQRRMQTEPSVKDREVRKQSAPNFQLACRILVWPLAVFPQRYMHYIKQIIPISELPPPTRQQMMNIRRLVPPDGESNAQLQLIKQNLEAKVIDYYYFSFRKSIGMRDAEGVSALLFYFITTFYFLDFVLFF